MPKTVLIQDNDVVISLDLAEAVLEAWPCSTLILCRTVQEAAARLAETTRLDIILLHPKCPQSQTVAQAAQAKGARVVWTDAEAVSHLQIGQDQGAATEWFALSSPFTTEDVLRAVR